MAKLSMLKPRIATLDTSIARLPPKTVDLAYTTPEHREWRRKVIERARGMCQRCGRNGTRLFADHITELRDGGAPFALSNGQALCGSCHTRKTAAERTRRASSRSRGA